MPTPVNRVDITPSSTGFQDVDITAFVGTDAGSIALAFFEVINSSGTNYDWGPRKKGSSDTRVGIIRANLHLMAVIGVDSNDVFEINLESITDLTLFLTGYATTAEAGNVSEAVDVSLSGTGSWTNIDITAHTGADVATCVFLLVDNTSGSGVQYGLRRDGSSDDRLGGLAKNAMVGGAMACGTGEIFEAQIDSLNVDFYLVGWLKGNFSAVTNATDKSTAVIGVFDDVDITGISGDPDNVDTSTTGGFFQIYHTSNGTRSWAFRPNGATFDNFGDSNAKNQYFFTGLDGAQVAEQKIEQEKLDVFCWGFTDSAGAAPVSAKVPQIALKGAD